MRTFCAALLVLVLTLLPAAAFAHASIAGVVKDSSGAAMRARDRCLQRRPFVVGRTQGETNADAPTASSIGHQISHRQHCSGLTATPRQLKS